MNDKKSDLVADLRQLAVAFDLESNRYMTVHEMAFIADEDLSERFRAAADEIERLRADAVKDALYKSVGNFKDDTEQADIFLQWKGINICADFNCTCGAHHHICDQDFVYYIKCTCGLTWEMPHTVAVKLVDEQDSCVYECQNEPEE